MAVKMWDTFVGGELLRLWFYTMSYNNNSLIYEHSGAEHSVRKVGLRWSQALTFCTSHLADASWLVVHTVWFTTSAVKFRDKPYQHRIYDMFIHVLYTNSWSFAYRLYRVAWLIWTGMAKECTVLYSKDIISLDPLKICNHFTKVVGS